MARKRKNPQNLRPATGEKEEQPQQSGSSTKKVRVTKNHQNVCPDIEMLPGEEEQKQQQRNDGVSMKKVESLSSPIVFPPPPQLRLGQLPTIAAQESLLRRLGLWEFVNLDLGEPVQKDLMNELVESYTYYPMKFTGESRVKDLSISLNRTAVAKALHLPVERAAKGWNFRVSEEESTFLEKLIWGHLVLRDASVVFDRFILEFFEGLKEMRLVNADWAGLLWFMMERELLQGQRNNLAKCYYVSHLQLVLKHQRPELFDDHHGAGREFGGVDQVIEDGTQDGSDTADSLENAAKLLLNLQDHYRSESDIQNVAEKKSSLAEFSGEEMVMNCLADDTAHGEEISEEGDKHCIQHAKVNITDELIDEEMYHNGGTELGLTQSDREDAQKLDKAQNDIYSEKYEVAGKRGTDHAPQAQQQVAKYEDKCQLEGFMLQDCTTADHSIVFQPPPRQILDIAAHESLLTRLGLWDFVQLELNETIRGDLIKELMVSYEFNTGESLVNGFSISLDRNAVVNALRLPAERFVKDGSFPVSEEEGLFLKELFWGHLVLRDGGGDASMMSLMSQTYVSRFAEILKDMRFEEADWAGLVWFMMESELLKGQRNNLVKCYYASHLQLVLKHQRPELFDDHHHEDEVVGSTDEDSGIQSVNVSDENDEHCADFTGDQIIEFGNLGVCQSDAVDSLENGAKLLLDLQTDLNAEIHSTENEDDLMQTEANEAAWDTSTDNAPKMHCTKEDYVVQYEGSEADTYKSADLHFEKKDDAMEDQETEAAFEANVGNSLDVHCVKDGENEANNIDSLTIAQNVAEKKRSLAELSGEEMDMNCVADDTAHREDHHQPEYVAEKNRSNLADSSGVEVECQEVHMSCMADHTRNKIEPAASVDLLVTSEAQDSGMKKEGSFDGLDDQIENHHNKNNIIENQHQSEDELINATEMNGDSIASAAGDAMDCQEDYMSCVPADTGMEVEHRAHDEVVREDASTDGLDDSQETENQHELELKTAVESIADVAGDELDCIAGMEVESGNCVDLLISQEGFTDVLDTQKIENHSIHLGSCQENNGNKFNLEISEEEDKHCIQLAKVNITDELIDEEMYHNGETELGLTQSDREDDAQKSDKVQNGIYSEDHAPQTRQDSEKHEDKCVAEGFVLQPCTTAAGHSFAVPSSFIYEEFAPSVHGNADGNEGGGHVSLRHFASETDMGLSMDGCNFGANVQSGSMIIGASDEHSEEELMDLDLCAEQVEYWTAKFKESAKRKVEEKHNSSMKLQKKIEEQNKMIQQYEFMLQMVQQQTQQNKLMLQKEQQQRQAGNHKYERELYLMQKVLEDYRKAIKATNALLVKYRRGAQVPEEPLYMPHPDGGGDVILVSEWKKLEEERQKKAIEAAVDDFEAVWSAYLEEEISALNQYDEKLEDLEHKVKTMRGRL